MMRGGADRPRVRRFTALALATICAVVLAACGRATLPREGSSIAPASAAPPVPSAASRSPQPSRARLEIDALPPATLDPTVLTALCDPEASQSNIDAGESTLFCGDGLILGLRAIRTSISSPIERLYLRRPMCRLTVCSLDELSTASVTGWPASGPVTVWLDSRLTTITAPIADPSATWPIGGSDAPPVQRPSFAGVPAAIAERTPYPFCGNAELDDDPTTYVCFRDAVLVGAPAEFIDKVYGAEGGAITWIYRYSGRGAIERYAGESGRWSRRAGSMILGPTPPFWSFDPWSGTDQSLS